jgi:hypothetical protein
MANAQGQSFDPERFARTTGGCFSRGALGSFRQLLIIRLRFL